MSLSYIKIVQEGKIDSLESKQVNLIYIHQPVDIISFLKSYLIGTLFCWLNSQDVTLSGLWHLCQIAGVKDSPATKVFQVRADKLRETLPYPFSLIERPE